MKANSSGQGAYAKASEKAKKAGVSLGSIVKHRNKFTKGSQEYNIAQNQINKYYGVSTKHKVLGVERDKDVRLANAKKNVQKKAGKTLAAVGKVAAYAKKTTPATKKAIDEAFSKKKKKKSNRVAGGN